MPFPAFVARLRRLDRLSRFVCGKRARWATGFLRLPSTYFGDLEAGFVPNKDFISRKMHVFGRLV
eukprot:SAG11_NODE_8352_length_1025_cov_2.698704_1_plen_64_part_01